MCADASIGMAGQERACRRALGVVFALSSLLATPALAQVLAPEGPAAETPAPPPPSPERPADDPAASEPQSEVQPEPVAKPDPRLILREQRERDLRIDRALATEARPLQGDFLAQTTVPTGLIRPEGLRVGNFIVLPSATLGAIFTDNIDAEDDERVDEVTLGAAGLVRLQSVLPRHSLGADAAVSSGLAVKGSDDSFFDWKVGADGRLDLTRTSSFNASADYTLGTEDATSAELQDDEVEAGEEVDVHEAGGNLGYLFRGRRFSWALNGLVDREDFVDGDQADRDNTTYTASTRATLDLTQRLAVFVAPEYADTRFDQKIADDGDSRNGQVITGLVGADYKPSARLVLGGALGYSQALFDDPDRDETGSVVGSGNVEWQISPKTSAELGLGREIGLTTVDDSSAETTTLAKAGITHILSTRNAISTEFNLINTDFNDLDRVDNDISARINLFHRLDQHLVLTLAYEYFQRLSDIDAEEFYENTALVGVTVVY